MLRQPNLLALGLLTLTLASSLSLTTVVAVPIARQTTLSSLLVQPAVSAIALDIQQLSIGGLSLSSDQAAVEQALGPSREADADRRLSMVSTGRRSRCWNGL